MASVGCCLTLKVGIVWDGSRRNLGELREEGNQIKIYKGFLKRVKIMQQITALVKIKLKN